MEDESDVISRKDAIDAVQVAMSRVALLHLAFSNTVVKELGTAKGRDLITKAIIEYGHLIAERVRDGLPDLPPFGINRESGTDEDGRRFVRGCIFADTFKALDAKELGAMYCYVDASKTMAMNPNTKMIHVACEVCGDDRCTFQTLPTNEDEKRAFTERSSKWLQVDPRLFDFIGRD